MHIEEPVIELSLDMKDWYSLCQTSQDNNFMKHTLLSKDLAYNYIEKMEGSSYARIIEPIKHLVDLFVAKEWIA